jgi:hypothetical protein
MYQRLQESWTRMKRWIEWFMWDRSAQQFTRQGALILGVFFNAILLILVTVYIRHG